MRIAVWHNLPSGGGKRALYDHVRGLVKRGHHVEIWCPRTADSDYLPLKDIAQEHVLPIDWNGGNDPLFKCRPIRSVSCMHSRLQAMDKHCQAASAQINDRSFDVLFANACSFFRVTSIGRHCNIPSALYLGEPYRWLYESLPRLPWEALAKNEDHSFHRRFKSFVNDIVRVHALRIQVREERTNAANFRTILVNSLFSRESVLRAYGLESEVCYLGVDFSVFKPTGEALGNYVIGLGGLYFGKGADRAIKALGQIPKEARPRLIWIGNFSSRPEEAELKMLAHTCEVDFSVRVRVSEAELVSLLSRAVAMIYTPRLEPFGYAPLEANACGTPVVALAEGGVRETIQHLRNGLLVATSNPVDIGNAVHRLIQDKTFAVRLRQQSLAHVRENWGLDSAIDRIESRLVALAGWPKTTVTPSIK